MIKIYALALLLLPGCGNVIGSDYHIVIDPNLSLADQSAAIEAAQNWEQALGGELNFNSISISSCLGERREICVLASSDSFIIAHNGNNKEIGLTVRQWYLDRADIYLPLDSDQKQCNSASCMLQNLTHEMGHAMGLAHTQAQTVMFWINGNASSTITCDDIAQWMELRQMSSKTELCPQGGTFSYFH